MKQKILLRRILKAGSLLLAVVLLLAALQEFVLCRLDDNRERIKGFYLEDSDSVDVVFIGASEVYAGFSAAYAYGAYGFTSYPVATRSNTVMNYLTCVKEAVRTQHPKLIVIEINGALYSDDFLDDDVNLRCYADHIPLNENKMELVDRCDPGHRLEYVLPLIKYHTVWNDPAWGVDWGASILLDRFRGYSLLKGVKNQANTYQPQAEILNDRLSDYADSARAPDVRAGEALTGLLDYCRDSGLKVLFVRFPHVVHKDGLARYERSLAAGELVKRYGFDYLGCDSLYREIGLSLTGDYYNAEHLNVYGQVKFTDYLCRVLMRDYGITPTQLTDAQQERWERCAAYYDAYYRYNDELIRTDNTGIEVGESLLSLWEIERYLSS